MKARNVLMVMAGMLLCVNVAMAQNPILKKYADRPGITRVYVSEAMLNMANQNPMMTQVLGMMGMSESPMKLTSFELMQFMNDDKNDFMKKDYKKIVTSKHNELVQTSSDKGKISIYGIGESASLSEMIIIIENDESLMLLLMTGQINFNELANTTMKYMQKK